MSRSRYTCGHRLNAPRLVSNGQFRRLGKTQLAVGLEPTDDLKGLGHRSQRRAYHEPSAATIAKENRALKLSLQHLKLHVIV